MKTIWSVEDFTIKTGRPPEIDDLDRANCKDAGAFGHHGCGICEHNSPVFMCQECFCKPEKEVKRI